MTANSPKKTMGTALQAELRKRNPFESPAQEAFLAVMRTQSLLAAPFERFFKQHGLSQATYNVLRILRGAGEKGRMCHEVGEHLVCQVPDVTRLIDRLENAGLCERVRSKADRRVVFVRITGAGEALLDRLSRPLLQLHEEQLGGLGEKDNAELLRLLSLCRDQARAHAETAGGAEKKAEGGPG